MTFHLVGLNHATAPISVREQLYYDDAGGAALLPRITALSGVEQCVLLSTCNRTEITIAGSAETALEELLAAEAGVPRDTLAPYLYHYHGREAILHLFRVACGLDSLVIGETQILGQIRAALELARTAGTCGASLNMLYQHAIAVGKRARAETAISHGAFSVGRAGVELLKSLFPTLAGSQVLILGAGKISELTARHLAACGVHAIFVANRTYAHAEELAARLNGRAIHYQQLPQALLEVDILLSSTSAPHYILRTSDLQPIMQARGERPLCLIDLAVPRDIDPAVSTLPNIHLYNIDDLQGITDSETNLRLAEIPRVERIIAEEVARCCTCQAGLDAREVICALRDAFETVRRSEMQRSAGMMNSFTPEQRAAIEAMTSSMINKLLHTPTIRLKEMLANSPDGEPLMLFAELFDLNACHKEHHSDD